MENPSFSQNIKKYNETLKITSEKIKNRLLIDFNNDSNSTTSVKSIYQPIIHNMIIKIKPVKKESVNNHEQYYSTENKIIQSLDRGEY